MDTPMCKSRWPGVPLQLGANTVANINGYPHVQVEVAGRLAARQLLEELALPIDHRVEGEADWNATIDIVPPADDAQELAVQLALRSDLRGTKIALPAPLGKPASSTTPLHVGLTFSPSEGLQRVDAQMAQVARGVIDFDAGSDQFLTRVHLGTGEMSSRPPHRRPAPHRARSNRHRAAPTFRPYPNDPGLRPGHCRHRNR